MARVPSLLRPNRYSEYNPSNVMVRRAAGQAKDGEIGRGRREEPEVVVIGGGGSDAEKPPTPVVIPPYVVGLAAPPSAGASLTDLVARASELRENLSAKNGEIDANRQLISTLALQRADVARGTTNYGLYTGYLVGFETEEPYLDVPTRVQIVSDPARIAVMRSDSRYEGFSIANPYGATYMAPTGMTPTRLPVAPPTFLNLPSGIANSWAFIFNRTSTTPVPPTYEYWLGLVEIQALTDRLHEVNATRETLQTEKTNIQNDLTGVEARISAATATATTGDMEVRVNVDGSTVALDSTAGTGPGPVFTFRDVTPGQHTVTASKTGYDTARVTVNVEAGRHVIVPITMVPVAVAPPAAPPPAAPPSTGGTLVINGVQHGRIRVDGAIYGEGTRRLEALFRDGALAGYSIPNLSFSAHTVEFLDQSGAVYSTTQVTLANTTEQRTATITFPPPTGAIQEQPPTQEGIRVPIWGVLLVVAGAGAVAYFLTKEG